ncbi:MAG: chloride channel protein [Terriglobia bacterium]|jgi:CIC family chloride channel protein|nr:chloride channel protein [Terriglobia bacterium]
MVEPEAKNAASPVRRKYWRTLGSVLTGEFLTAREEQFFLLLAIFIGIFSGLAVVCFRIAIESARLVLLGSSLKPSFPRVVFIPAAVGLLIAILVIRFFPRARGSGVNQTKGALYIYDGYIAGDTVIGKFITSALAIGSGQSLGPEDPALQIGAGLASFLGRRLKLSRERLRLIAPVGAAAGLAAAFNAPITAVLFVIEEVVGRWSAGTLGAIVLSAISSVVVERWFLGDAPLFRIPQYHLVHPGELGAYAILGVIGGFASLAFVKMVSFLRPWAKRLPPWTQYFQPAVAGAIIGVIAIWFPQVMGAGYDYMDQAMHGQFPWKLLLILAGLKIAATGFSFSSGTPGGLFAPTLFIGAMIGGGVGMFERALFPHLSVPVGAYAMVGMGTLFAGILRAPMTSVFMILEVSGNYSIILPVIISDTIAYFISRQFQPTPIFDLLSRQDGLDLPSLEEERELEVLRVETAMQPRPIVLSGFEMLADARRIAQASGQKFFLVQMASGNWAGITKEALMDGNANDQAPLATVAGQMLPQLYPDHPLDYALRMIGELPMLPVVHRADHSKLLGVINLEDVIRAYRTSGGEAPERAPL